MNYLEQQEAFYRFMDQQLPHYLLMFTLGIVALLMIRKIIQKKLIQKTFAIVLLFITFGLLEVVNALRH